MSKAASFGILCVLTMAVPALAQSWWNPRWTVRRTVTLETPSDNGSETFIRPAREGCTVTFLTGGECKPDGSDIRVTTADGRPVKYFILSVGPGDLVRLAFDAHGAGKQRYLIYYGNPEAPEEKNEFHPRGGLLLESWNSALGPIGTADAIRETVKSAAGSPLLGRAYIPALFVGMNLFAPGQSTCERYSGLLACRQGGTYGFTLSCFDAGAIFVDGKEVLAWPGRHGWVGDVRHQANVELKAGVHEFEFYHVNIGRHGGAVVAWRVPGSSTFRILEADHFLPLGRGQLGPLEKRGKDLVADFGLQQTGTANMESNVVTTPLFRYEFTATNLPAGKKNECEWDFGDGQTASGEKNEHVFFGESLRSVRLRVKRGTKTDTITSRVHIGLNRLNPQANAVRLAELEPAVSRYHFSQIPLADAATVMDFFIIANRPDRAIEVGEAASHLVPSDQAQRDRLSDCARRTASLLIDRRDDYRQAAALLIRAAKNVEPQTPVYRLLAAEAASIYTANLGDDAKAETLLRSCVGQSTQPAQMTDRHLIVAWGDLYRSRGDRAAAEDCYRRAKSADVKENAPTRGGGYVTAVEDYLRRKEFSEARKLLDQWDWDDPPQRLGGYSCLLRYRLLRAQRHFPQAKLLARTITAIDPFGFYGRQIAKESQ